MDYYLKLGDKCNNNCFFCNAMGWTLSYKKDLSRIKQEILEAIKNGINRVIICWGEAALREDFFSLLDYTKKNNVGIKIVSNGRIFSYNDFTKKVLKYTDCFSISLFSHLAKIHDRITNVPGSFNQTMKGIKNILKNSNRADVNILTVVTNFNKNNISDIARIAFNLHATSFSVFIPESFGDKSVFPEIGGIAKSLIETYEYCRNNNIKFLINGVSKNLRYILNYYYSKSMGKPYYFRVDLHPIYGCNSQCIICDNWKNRVKKRFSKGELISLIDELVDFGVRELRFHGQEPTLRKDLIELISYAKQKGLVVGLKTNCNLLSKNYAEKLAKTNIDTIYVSIDSATPKIHNRIRGNKYSFNNNKKAVKYIKKFSNSRIKIFSNTVVTNLNYRELGKMLDLAKVWGIDKVSFVQLNSKNKKDVSSVKLSKKQLEEFFFNVAPRIFEKSIAYHIPVSFSPIFAELVNEEPEIIIRELKGHKEKFMREIGEYSRGEYGKTFYEKFGCFGPLDHATIDPEGEIFSCCVMPRRAELSKGNIGKENFIDIFNKRDYRIARKESNINCKFHYDCGSNLSSRKSINCFINSQPLVSSFNEPNDYINYLNNLFFLSKDRIEAIQFRKLKGMLSFAFFNILFYKKVLKESGLSPHDIRTKYDLRKIPITTKDDIRKNFPRNLLFKNLNKEIIFENTSGSSADRVDFARARAPERFLKRVFSYSIASNFSLGDLYAVFTTPHCSAMSCQSRPERDPPSYVKEIILPTQMNILNSSEEAVSERIKILKENKPKVLHVDPFYLKSVVLYAKRKGIKLPKFSMISSTYELLTEKTKKLFEKEFNCKVFDEYGCSEIGPIAFSCEKGNKHIFSDSVFVEVVPFKKSGLGRIIVTDLDNHAMPFIRYESGDVGIIKDKKCSCGRNTSILEVYGRLDECVMVGKKIITPKEFTHYIDKIDGIDFYQAIIKDRKNIGIKIVRNSKWQKESEANLESAIKKLFGQEIKVNIDFVNGIVTETSGKFKIIKIPPELRAK